MKWDNCRKVMEQHAIKIDDMATEDAYFLATHMPFSKLEVYEGGQTSGTPKLMSEDEVFNNLIYNPDNQHRMIIVRGNNGTGKSHLIRFLKAKFENSPSTVFNPQKEQIVFLRRLNNSVRGALSQLLEQNVIRDPEVAEKLRKFVDSTESKDEEAFKNDIFYAYVSAVSSDQSNVSYHNVICRNIASYLSDSRVKEHLLREDGAISRCYQVITSSSRQVMQDNVIFTEDDFNDRKLIRAVKKQGDPQASDFATTLAEGEEEIEKLVQYLNRFTGAVVQRCAGVSSESTKTIFEELRKDLKKQGKNLTLFVEDFTGFTGIDSEMITVLSTEHGGDYEFLCRVTAVIGITDGYYDQFKDNFRDRVTHQINVTERTFGTQEFLVQMAGRYLNAIYTSPEDIQRWYQNGAEASLIPTSGFQPAFNWDTVEVNGKEVTLFPFNKKALWELYEILQVKSPRMFLRDVVRAQLKEYFDGKTYGDQWRFPIYNIRAQMSNAVHSAAIDRMEDLPSTDRERLKFLLAVWGNGSASGIATQDGVFFGGVNKQFLDDIAIPFKGIGEIKNAGDEPKSTPDKLTTPVGEQQQKPQPQNPRERDYQLRINDINSWYSNGTELQYHPDYRQYLKEFICGTSNQAGAIPWQDMGISAYIANERLSDLSAYYIEGQGAEKSPNCIIHLDRSVETRDVLRALCERDYANGWNFESAIYHQQQLVVWIERHKAEIVENVLSIQNEDRPAVVLWGLALQNIRRLATSKAVQHSSWQNSVRSLFDDSNEEVNGNCRTKPWEDLASYVRNHKSEFDAAITLARKTSLTTMGAIYGSRGTATKPFYRAAELAFAYEELIKSNWNLSDRLPEELRGNFLYTPAKLLKGLYPRINTVVAAEIEDYKRIVEQLNELVGTLNQENLMNTFNAIRNLFSTFSANGVPGYKEMRDKYEHIAPIEKANAVLLALRQLEGVEKKTVMEQFEIFSSDAKSSLKELLIDLQNIDRIAAKEEQKAVAEMQKNAVPEGLDQIIQNAKESLGLLYDRMNEMEVQYDNGND